MLASDQVSKDFDGVKRSFGSRLGVLRRRRGRDNFNGILVPFVGQLIVQYGDGAGRKHWVEFLAAAWRAGCSVYGRTNHTGGPSDREDYDRQNPADTLRFELRKGAGFHAPVCGDGCEARPADGGKAARCSVAAR